MKELPRLPVVAAIPNYNMADSLATLLPSLKSQGYDEIYVLDDASTDNSVELAGLVKGVTIVAGADNRGSGGGFDPNLRVHDILDIAVKLKLRGEKFCFDPSIAVTHKAIDVRGPGRRAEENQAMRYLFRKYGLKLLF